MAKLALLAAAAAVLLAGCGDEEAARRPAKPPAGQRVDLEVVVRPQGPAGPARTRKVRCRSADEPSCRRLLRLDLRPVPRKAVCTAVSGGPAVARVTGTLSRRRVDARFKLTNGCEIARWRRNAALLGPPPPLRGR